MNKKSETARKVRGLGQALRLGLYIAMALSALITLVALPALQSRVHSGQLGPSWLLVPAIAFGMALGIYLFDRIYLVRYRHYSSGRAMFQISFGLIFLFLLFPSRLAEYRQVIKERPAHNSLMALMKHSDPRVRALAYELAAYRKQPRSFIAPLAQGLRDKDQQAAGRAQVSLQKITGQHFAIGELVDVNSLMQKAAPRRQDNKHSIKEDAGSGSASNEDAAVSAGGAQ